MPPTIALVHAVLPALAPMEEALAIEWPQAQVRHLLDEGLSTEVIRYGGVSSQCVARMYDVLHLAARTKPDAILLTCTAYSTMVPEARDRFPGTPLFAVDQMMVETAVAQAQHIGILATFEAGLEQHLLMLETRRGCAAKRLKSPAACIPKRWRPYVLATPNCTIASCWTPCRNWPNPSTSYSWRRSAWHGSCRTFHRSTRSAF